MYFLIDYLPQEKRFNCFLLLLFQIYFLFFYFISSLIRFRLVTLKLFLQEIVKEFPKVLRDNVLVNHAVNIDPSRRLKLLLRRDALLHRRPAVLQRDPVLCVKLLGLGAHHDLIVAVLAETPKELVGLDNDDVVLHLELHHSGENEGYEPVDRDTHDDEGRVELDDVGMELGGDGNNAADERQHDAKVCDVVVLAAVGALKKELADYVVDRLLDAAGIVLVHLDLLGGLGLVDVDVVVVVKKSNFGLLLGRFFAHGVVDVALLVVVVVVLVSSTFDHLFTN